MGRSHIKGNSGFLGLDKRGQYSGDTVGSVSVQKHYLERRLGHFEPIIPPTPPAGKILFEDDFSTGDLSKWNVVNGSEASTWIVGTDVRDSNGGTGNEGGSAVTIPSGQTYAAFVSNNGTNNYYDPSSDVHMYFDVTIPLGATALTLTFDWMCFGERSTSTTAYLNYDLGYIMMSPTTFTPAAGTKYDDEGTGSPRSWARLIGGTTAPNDDGGRFTSDGAGSRDSGAQDVFVQETITITSTNPGTTGTWCTNCDRRFSFSWMCDGSVQDNPSFTVANVVLKYED